MKRIIDFQVSVAGLDTEIVRVEYNSKFSHEELKSLPYTEGGSKVVPEAIDNLEKALGRNDFEVNYWWWIK